MAFGKLSNVQQLRQLAVAAEKSVRNLDPEADAYNQGVADVLRYLTSREAPTHALRILLDNAG